MRKLLVLVVVAGCGESAVGEVDMAPPDLAVAPDLTPVCVPGRPDAAVAFPDPDCPVARPDTPDTLDEALQRVGLDRCSFGWKRGVVRGDAFTLPWYLAVHDHPTSAPAFAARLVARLDEAAAGEAKVAGLLAGLGEALGFAVVPCVAPPPVDGEGEAPFAEAVARLAVDWGGKPDRAAITADAADLPPDLGRALAAVVAAIADGNRAYDQLLFALPPSEREELASVTALALRSGTAPTVTDKAVQELLAKRFDLAALARGAAGIALGVEQAKLGRFAGRRGFSFDQPTPLGRIVVRDAANDTYEDDPKRPILLLVDTGGDDRYRIAAGAIDGTLDLKSHRHTAVVIDLAGQDRYGYEEFPIALDGKRLPSDGDGRYRPQGPPKSDNGPISLSETPRQGAARLGYGLLFDLGGGNDSYRSLRMSQGAGIAGVGVLYDDGGDDTYAGEALVQGAAIFGLGLLVDGGGSDIYRTYTESQGFGYVRACGLLYDRTGNDRFLADVGDPAAGGDPLYFTPQLPGVGNSSFTQGAGFGRRADSTDKVNMSGGIGILRDYAGDDIYTTSVFGQGSGYWLGTGLLADRQGNDRYDGKWYVQGAAAHSALALFLDDAGNDLYNQTLVPSATSLGVGHDLSLSWHVDGGGNDTYRAPGLSLGSGHANGIGVFLNLGGDDRYEAPAGNTFGAATIGDADFAERRLLPTAGLFLDLGGKDTYPALVPLAPGNDKSWPNNVQGMGYNNHGLGMDRAAGTVALP